MKTILVPTDFSVNANNALNYAMELGKKENSKIILLHAFHITYIFPDVPVKYLTEQVKSTEQLADKQLKLLSEKVEKSAKLKCEIINKESLAVDLILDTIDKKKPDFVVMGTKGASGIKEMIMGSNTGKIVEKAKCPVIVVPENALFSPIEDITYATDYNVTDIFALEKLVDIAKFFNSTITLLHVCYEVFTHETEEDFMNVFKSTVRKDIMYNKLDFKLVYGKHFIDVLENYIKHENPNLISMSANYKNLFDKFFGTSLTKKMASHTTVPLLVFHYEHMPIVFN